MSRRKSFAIMTDSRISRNFSHASLSPPTVTLKYTYEEYNNGNQAWLCNKANKHRIQVQTYSLTVPSITGLPSPAGRSVFIVEPSIRKATVVSQLYFNLFLLTA